MIGLIPVRARFSIIAPSLSGKTSALPWNSEHVDVIDTDALESNHQSLRDLRTAGEWDQHNALRLTDLQHGLSLLTASAKPLILLVHDIFWATALGAPPLAVVLIEEEAFLWRAALNPSRRSLAVRNREEVKAWLLSEPGIPTFHNLTRALIASELEIRIRAVRGELKVSR